MPVKFMFSHIKMTYMICLAALTFGLMPCDSRAENVPTQLIGSWTSYYYRSGPVIFRYDVVLSVTELTELVSFVTKAGLVPVDGEMLRQTFTISSVTASSENVGAYIFSLALKSTETSPSGEWSAEDLGRKSYCGFTSWQAGVFRDISGRLCNDGEAGNTIRHPRAGTRSSKHLLFRDGKLYLKQPISFEGEDIPDSRLDMEHPLFAIEK